MDRGGPDDRVDTAAVRKARVHHWVEAVDVPAGGGDHATDRLQELILVLEVDVGLGKDATPFDEDLVGTVDHDLAHGPVVQQAVEGTVPDGGAKDDVRQRGLLERCQLDAIVRQEAVEVRSDCAREGERVAGRQADVADQRQAVAEIIRELGQVMTLPGRRLDDVGSAPVRLRCVGGA